MSRLAILVAAGIALGAMHCAAPESGEWAVVSQDTLIVGVDVEGTLKAVDQASMGPPGISSMWRFTISDLIEDGEVVEEGAKLFSFDATELRDRLRNKENDRDSTKVTLEKRRFEIELAKQDEALQLAEAEATVRKAAIGADQSTELTGSLILKNAKLDLLAAEANVEHLRTQMKRRQSNNQREIATRESWVRTAEKAVKSLSEDIDKLTVKAPRAGTAVVENRGNEKYKVGDQVWRSDFVVQVATLDKMMAEGYVDEADFGQLVVGQKIHLRLEAHPDSEVEGELSEIARSVQQKWWLDEPGKAVTVQLQISPIEDLKLRPGMRFRGEVETERIADAVIIPLSSVFPSQAGPIAFRDQGGSIEKVLLVLGKRGKRGVQVLKGLSAGDRVSRRDLRRQP